MAMVAVASVALPQKQKIKPAWWWWHMVTCLLGGAKMRTVNPAMVVVAFPLPPASRCHLLDTDCHQLPETDHHSFQKPTTTSFWKLATTASI